MKNENILDFKINSLQKLLDELSKKEGINPKDTLLDYSLSYEIILNLKVSTDELNSLNSLPCLSINSDNLNKMVELCMYNELENQEKHPLVEKYLTSANVIGAESILFYVPYK